MPATTTATPAATRPDVPDWSLSIRYMTRKLSAPATMAAMTAVTNDERLLARPGLESSLSMFEVFHAKGQNRSLSTDVAHVVGGRRGPQPSVEP